MGQHKIFFLAFNKIPIKEINAAMYPSNTIIIV